VSPAQVARFAGPSAGRFGPHVQGPWRTDNRRSLVSGRTLREPDGFGQIVARWTGRHPSERVIFGETGYAAAALCSNEMMEIQLESLTGILEQTDGRLRAGSHAAARVWPTGFDILDKNLANGFRSGELVLLGGPQGLGKTTWALQVARNVARSGRSVVFFSFEHDPQTMLIRLVALEAGEIGGVEAPGISRIRESFEATDGPGGPLTERLADTVGGAEAVARVTEYSDRLMLHRSTGSTTSLEVIREAVDVARKATKQLPLVVVDYLQKVKVQDGSQVEDERVTRVVEGLKDLALDLDIPVLAVVAADKAGITSGKRMRVNNLRGSSALAYEADTVLILNNKFDVVARHHLVYDIGNAERFKYWAVLSIEKNRNGQDQIDLEFKKRFDQSRFENSGQVVVEQLVDERVFVE
jgi:replicative DNA helicase